MTRIGSLCSGYEGLGMGLAAALDIDLSASLAWHAEYEAAPSAVLAHHWPSVPNLHDITLIDWAEVEPVEWITAGYPCQPFSTAGQRKGEDDDRHLWPYVAEAIRVLRPRRILLENVAGHRSLGLGRVLGDLAEIGYVGSWHSLRASDIGAPHQRERIFIFAADPDDGPRDRERPRTEPRVGGEAVPNAGDGAVPEGPRSPGREGGQRASVGRELGQSRDCAPADTIGGRRDGRAPQSIGCEVGRVAAAGGGEAARWGEYEPAIRRWERRLGRSAPAPARPGRAGVPQLSAEFVEWMMGLPAGHVTAVPGLTRNEMLKILGNGVVPAQATEAVRWLTSAVAA